jgi:AcrR family transcriptional regulator
VRVESLARALGVTKGGFYGHFDDRNGLLDEMLDAWERLSVDEVIEQVATREPSCGGYRAWPGHRGATR